MNHIILFILTFILVFFIYQMLLLGKRKSKKKQPLEVKYLEAKYQIDINKINQKKLWRTISLVSSLDISLIVTVASLFENYLIQLLVIMIIMIPVIIISYRFVGNYYQKKGMIKDE